MTPSQPWIWIPALFLAPQLWGAACEMLLALRWGNPAALCGWRRRAAPQDRLISSFAEPPRLEMVCGEEKHYSVHLPSITHSGFLYKTPSMVKPISERKGPEGTCVRQGGGSWEIHSNLL